MRSADFGVRNGMDGVKTARGGAAAPPYQRAEVTGHDSARCCGPSARDRVANFLLIRLQIKAKIITKRLKAIGMPEKNIQTCLNDFASSAASSEVGGGASGAKWKKYIKMIVVRTLNAKAGAAMRIAGRRRPSAAGNTAAKATTVQPMPPK